MNSNMKNNEPDFNSLFESLSSEDMDKHEARMIMYRFLSEIERVYGKKRGLKSLLAQSVGKSKSFITQLFNGDKIVSLSMLAKFQRALGIKFKIIAYDESEFYKYTGDSSQYAINIFLAPDQNVRTQQTVAGKSRAKEFVQIRKNSQLWA